MPQMAPYNWLNLFFMFNFLMMYMMTNMYFFNFKMKLSKNMKLNIIKYLYNWKW